MGSPASPPPAETTASANRRRFHLVVGLLAPGLLLALQLRQLRAHTVDDAYISFRYARNLVEGNGLVYNVGERVEGYTNFLWTLALAGGMRLGAQPEDVAKLLGAVCALGLLWATYALSQRLSPLRVLPCLATWFVVCSGGLADHAIAGLETSAFAFLVVAGTLAFWREVDEPRRFPWSGIVFALAGLTRPEAPLLLGIPMLLLGRGFLARQNLIRIAVFGAPLLAHLIFRLAYYGEWVPMTFVAKTGELGVLVPRGWDYVWGYLEVSGTPALLGLLALPGLVRARERALAGVALVALAYLAYVVSAGGDWMWRHRLLVPIEPFSFVLAGVGTRRLFDAGGMLVRVALGVVVLGLLARQAHELRHLNELTEHTDRRYWRLTAAVAADYLLEHGPPGSIAMGDIGEVGYRTNYRIIDLLGLVEPEIARAPGSYRDKPDQGVIDFVFGQQPEYIILVMPAACRVEPGNRINIRTDPRLYERYTMRKRMVWDRAHTWCIFVRNDVALH